MTALSPEEASGSESSDYKRVCNVNLSLGAEADPPSAQKLLFNFFTVILAPQSSFSPPTQQVTVYEAALPHRGSCGAVGDQEPGSEGFHSSRPLHG